MPAGCLKSARVFVRGLRYCSDFLGFHVFFGGVRCRLRAAAKLNLTAFCCVEVALGPAQRRYLRSVARTRCATNNMQQGGVTPKRGRRRRAPSDTFEERAPLRLAQDDLETPTTTVKDNCLSWDLHEAAATVGGAEAVRRFLVGGGDPGSDQWGNSALHVSRRTNSNFPSLHRALSRR